ncbi:hypothetical protein A3L01_09065 [Thermococcus barossii]|uniref:Uncharacterized protein n=1 Tax=Thermococcus barossii TaxID=54077 RepID=A0A2Z2MNS4_9EURY|nr:hypothetical protein A3L01_09065 [Thermococcus barossii]
MKRADFAFFSLIIPSIFCLAFYILLFNKAYKPLSSIIYAFLCIRCFLWSTCLMFKTSSIKLVNWQL